MWLSIGSILVLLFVWWLATYLGWIKPLFLPSPGAIVTKFFTIVKTGYTDTSFLEHVTISTARGSCISAGLSGRSATRVGNGRAR